MKGLLPIVGVVAALAAVPLVIHSNVVLNFLVVTLMIALAGQGWNILGGYGGQYSFGHAAFFGTGAYVTAILQVRYGVNAWIGFAAGIVAGAAVGAIIGGLAFRAGLRSSYFALVTLAFAEVLRILASVAPITGAGVGLLVKLDLRAQSFQFQSRAIFYYVILALVGVSLVIAQLLERSRFGTWLIAVRENEDAAMALGVDAIAVKLAAMVLSAAITAAAGCFYVQYFLFIDSGIAYGTWISIEALLTPIIGGVGTVFGALVGALLVKSLGEGVKLVTGDVPGLDLMIYGAVLIVVIRFAPRGLVGAFIDVRERLARRLGRRDRRCGRRPVVEPLLAVEHVSRRFGGLLAVNAASLSAPRRPDHRPDRPQWRRQDHALCHHFRFPQAERRPRPLWRRGRHRRAAAPACPARHRANLPDRAAVRRVVGARQHSRRRASAPSRTRRRAGRCRRGGTRGRARRHA